MYAEIIGRYLSRGEQDSMQQSVPDAPWATEDDLDMPGLMASFQEFWRFTPEGLARSETFPNRSDLPLPFLETPSL